MRYELAMTERRLSQLLLGLVVLAFLLFAAGVVTGIQLLEPFASLPSPPAPKPATVVAEPEPAPAMPPAVVEPEAQPEITMPPATDEGDQELIYELQLAFAATADEARAALEDFSSRGYEAYLIGVKSSAGITRYTVRIGPYESMEIAQAQAVDYFEREGELAVIRYRDAASE